MSESLPDFVEWREQYINQERGSRLVHYYLEDSSGESYLAVVGAERSLRHMLYVSSSELCQASGGGRGGRLSDWLTSFIPGRMSSRSYFSNYSIFFV